MLHYSALSPVIAMLLLSACGVSPPAASDLAGNAVTAAGPGATKATPIHGYRRIDQMLEVMLAPGACVDVAERRQPATCDDCAAQLLIEELVDCMARVDEATSISLALTSVDSVGQIVVINPVIRQD
jgi:hypothetical protein